MTVTKDDFDKIWASQSPLTPYSFSESQYKEGWNFVGGTPPSRQMWDAFMQGADEKLKYLYQHEDVPVGFEYFTMNPNIPQGSLPLLGGEYSRETYADLWSWVQEQTGYLKTEAEWQVLSTSNNGNVPFYSDGDGSTTFRVPSLHCWIKGSDGSAQLVGSYLEAGLPNITGNSSANMVSHASWNAGSGALMYIYKGASGVVTTGDMPYGTIDFDASRSSSIYGNSNTVQPESIVGMWLVKAYGVIVDTGTIDEQAYIDDRFNALKQYTDDEVNDAVTTLNTNISAINTRLGTVLEITGSSTAVNSNVTLCSISTHSAGVWLIVSYVALNYTSANPYNNVIVTTSHGSTVTRNTSGNGGGSTAVMITALDENEVVSTQGYKLDAGTIAGRLTMVQLA